MFTKNNEEKRNILWRVVITVSTILIILIAAFFVIKLFTSNPLEGKWVQEDSGMILTFEGENQVLIQWPEEFGGEDVKIWMDCEIDVDMKTLNLQIQEEQMETAFAAALDDTSTANMNLAIQTIEGTYEYNIEQNILTLTEREYGEQMIFDKQ